MQDNVKWSLFLKRLVGIHNFDVNSSASSSSQQRGLQVLLSLGSGLQMSTLMLVINISQSKKSEEITLLGRRAMPTVSLCVSFGLPGSISLEQSPATWSVPPSFVGGHKGLYAGLKRPFADSMQRFMRAPQGCCCANKEYGEKETTRM